MVIGLAKETNGCMASRKCTSKVTEGQAAITVDK
jgi:hypothetical protein